MFWKDYPTKTAAESAIRSIIDPQPFKEPFESTLISDLIYERHYFCSRHGLRPIRFRKIPKYGNYSFEGDFSQCDCNPKISWHPVSWTKCLKPPPDEWGWITRAMRDRCEVAKTKYRQDHQVCEDCGCRESGEVHHKSPSFLSITQAIRAEISNEDITSCLGAWNWFAKDDFSLPDDHFLARRFDALHEAAILQALCRECHNRTKKKSK